MAFEETWKKLKYFKPTGSDNFGEPYAIDDALILILDDFRDYIAVPIFVLHGTDGIHSKDSFHYKENGACAVDVILPDFKGHPVDLVLAAERMGFRGLGYYPHWQINGRKGNGLHLDTRPLVYDNDGTYNYNSARWMGVLEKDENGHIKQQYIGLTYENILKYGGTK